MPLDSLLQSAGFGVVTAVSTITDLRTRRIPDGLLGCGLIFTLLLTADLRSAVCGGVVGLAAFWTVRSISGGKLGMGDVKYSAYIGSVVGPGGWWSAVALAAGGALLYALLSGRPGKQAADGSIPFAPFLSAGALLAPALPLFVALSLPTRVAP